jgi:hypothetical protein
VAAAIEHVETVPAAETGIGGGATPARSVDQVTRTPDAPRAGGRGGIRPALDYALLTPPNYNNIVGGTAPSPIASLLLIVGALLILVAVVLTMAGTQDTTQWWASGAVLAAVGLFLAAFVSRD